jgi:hypothetical protein
MNEQKEDRLFNIFFTVLGLCGIALVITVIWAAVQIVQWVVSK